ncbi:hypothetical protein I3843_10G026400 [Carya illinoinensis]|nr:hypothetical protein I3760_10G026900 [Carya illinoinensis]KAG7958561.1 hypothetical protein I3843_10G026400 [Carya illinoinensis]
MKKISCRTLVALLAVILIEILVCCSLCQCHESYPRDHQRLIQSRKLLLSTASVTVSTNDHDQNKLNGTMKDPKKAVGPSLRKAPPSVPNPTQNKERN